MNKKLFKKQMMTIAISVGIMILTFIVANYLKTYGLSKLFTTNLYKTAFSVSQYDRFLINVYATAIEVVTMIGCYMTLSCNRDIAKIEREEELFMKGVNMEWEKA